MKLLRLLIFVGICAASCHAPKQQGTRPPVEVTAFKVEPQTIPAPFEFVGVARSSHPVEIRARVEGYLNTIDYTEGSMVEPGQKLFQLDPLPFEASLQEAKGELARQEAILWRAQKALERIAPLFEKNAVSERDLDDATAGVLTAEASVIVAQANVVQAELNLGYTYVTSPIRGLTGRAVFKEGTLITPNVNGLLTLVSIIDPIWVLFSVSDNEWLQGQTEKAHKTIILPKAQEYSVSLTLADGSVYPYLGTVNFTSPTLDPETGAMVVRAEFKNPEALIRPGQFVKATAYGAMRPHAIFVPQQAVQQGSKEMYVFVIDSGNKAHIRSVEVGEWYNNFWIITQGLQEGDVVVADGVNKVNDNAEVHIVSYVPPPKLVNPKGEAK